MTTANPRSELILQRTPLEQEAKKFRISDGASLVLSVFYGAFVINLTIVFTVSQHTTIAGPHNISEYYLNALFSISIAWLTAFAISIKWGCNRSDVRKPVKEHLPSNRWLKGVLAVFGFSITVKDALELVALAEITNPFCHHKPLHILMPLLHAPFVFGQVAFLFYFSKHHIQECRHTSRFGLMHIMATNLSVWFVTVVAEAKEAHEYETQQRTVGTHYNDTITSLTKVTEAEEFDNTISLFHGNCTCATGYCQRVIEADKFLFPFLIEFCLISTCLLYVTWRRIGMRLKERHHHVKPSYRFYKAYKGPTLGASVLVATITVIVALGGFDKVVDDSEKTYLSQYQFLHLYEWFLTVCELINLLACLVGFYLYSRLKSRKLTPRHINIDDVLLFVCFIGPLLLNLFSILALSAGPLETKAPGWGISLVYPVVDVFCLIVQVLFILYGKQYIPKATVIKGKISPLEDRGISLGEPTTEVSTFRIMSDEVTFQEASSCPEVENRNSTTNFEIECSRNDETAMTDAVSYLSTSVNQQENRQPKTELKENSKTSPDLPRVTRSLLCDVLMFLIISNASLWIFLSLDKTLFTTLAYQYDYFGHSTWTTLTAITTPLSIFLRMHSAACFFEMWSFA